MGYSINLLLIDELQYSESSLHILRVDNVEQDTGKNLCCQEQSLFKSMHNN